MNTSAYIEPTTSVIFKSWFISFDIIMFIFSVLPIILSIVCLLIILLDDTCHTVPMMLVANSCFSGLLVGCAGLGFSLFALHNDLKRIHFQDSLCIIRAYFGYGSCSVFILSFFVQAIYRYVKVVYPTCLIWKLLGFQIVFIGLTWILGYIHLIVYIYTDDIVYNVDNQICQIPLRFSLSAVCGTLCVYLNPILLILLIYVKLLRYVRRIRKHVTPTNVQSRAEKEFKMVKRITILIMILIVLGFPYTVFIIMSFFTTPPRYHYRIGFLFIYLGLSLVMIALLQFTRPLKAAIMKKFNSRLTRMEMQKEAHF